MLVAHNYLDSSNPCYSPCDIIERVSENFLKVVIHTQKRGDVITLRRIDDVLDV